MADKAIIVTDLGYGDAGKGTTVDYLARLHSNSLVVRHNGGAQAAHNVVTPDGRHHTFAQFGSGSFVPGTRTHLSQYMLINPLNMMAEADHLISLGLHDMWERTTVDFRALIITPWQKSANHIREKIRGRNRHGSCGQGIGETMSDSLTINACVVRAGDIGADVLRDKLHALRTYKYCELVALCAQEHMWCEELESPLFTDDDIIDLVIDDFECWRRNAKVVSPSEVYEAFNRASTLIFEGAQGVLLDENVGFHPYTTWSTTTHANALSILDEMSFEGDIVRLGVIRSYSTRHGEGPFVTRDREIDSVVREVHNGFGPWQGEFRNGWLDLVALKYAVTMCGGVDALMVTGMDWLERSDSWKVCTSYCIEPKFADSGFFNEVDGRLEISSHQRSLDEQENLTKALFEVIPEYEIFSGTTHNMMADLHGAIESMLGAPVVFTSHGPTWQEKRHISSDRPNPTPLEVLDLRN
jgi:adenylosuccinate synthase